MPGNWTDLGPAELWWGVAPALVGPSFGGVRYRLKHTSAPVMQDITGTEPVDMVFTGQTFEIEANLTSLSLEQLKAIIPGASLSAGPVSKMLSLSSPVGTSMKDNAQAFILKPIIAGVPTVDEKLWIKGDKAYPNPDFEVVWDVETQRVYKTIWNVFRNASGILATMGKDAAV